MAWKMSIDLTRPLVPSMGQHDPIDGLSTSLQLWARDDGAAPALEDQIRDYGALASLHDWRTDDPLGVGGLLTDACHLAQLEGVDALPSGGARDDLVVRLLDAALAGVAAYARQQPLRQPAAQRLAFRELGLAIGLQGVARIDASRLADPVPLAALLARLSHYAPLARSIADTWRDPQHQRTHAWRMHEDINAVMLATCLLPSGYLDLE